MVMKQKPVTKAIRLNNNNLENLDGFEEAIDAVMNPLMLAWIDLSFNDLTTIDEVIVISLIISACHSVQGKYR